MGRGGWGTGSGSNTMTSFLLSRIIICHINNFLKIETECTNFFLLVSFYFHRMVAAASAGWPFFHCLGYVHIVIVMNPSKNENFFWWKLPPQLSPYDPDDTTTPACGRGASELVTDTLGNGDNNVVVAVNTSYVRRRTFDPACCGLSTIGPVSSPSCEADFSRLQ